MTNGKKIWEDIASTEAYFGVSTHDRFIASNLDEAGRADFFESGVNHVAMLWNELEAVTGKELLPEIAMDYGCGVGRVLVPLAERSGSVVGVDISTGMIEEARKNLDHVGVTKYELKSVDEFMRDDQTVYDFVHSYIVLQHIEPRRGYRIIRKMLEGLRSGGIGMIHLTHTANAPLTKRIRAKVYRDLPLIHVLSGKIRGETRPFIPMYSYDMERFAAIMTEHKCRKLKSVPTDHGYLGEMVFFVKE